MTRDPINVPGSAPDSVVVHQIDLAEVAALDLRKVLAEESGYTAYYGTLMRHGRLQTNEPGIQIIFHAEAGRAGVAWGADASWTDAGSAEDAADRYFGVDGKEMVN